MWNNWDSRHVTDSRHIAEYKPSIYRNREDETQYAVDTQYDYPVSEKIKKNTFMGEEKKYAEK